MMPDGRGRERIAQRDGDHFAAGLMALCVLLLIAIGAIRDTTPTR